ncbi:MAG: T9SS type A sorting domain-containing protein [Flavobacteriales bacterium]
MQHKIFRILASFLLVGVCSSTCAQFNLVSYAGNSGRETFYDAVQLSDHTFLVCGYADNLDWIESSVPTTELSYSGTIPNSLGSNRFGFIIQFSSDFSHMLHMVHFPQGVVEDVRFMKFTSLPYQATGELFISCNTSDTYDNDGGYIIAKLNGNFVNQVPTSTVWHKVVWAMSYAKESHPWDVTADGEVYYVSGEAHGYDWSALYCLDVNGNRKTVEHWRTHWLNTGTEWKGTPASANPTGSIDNVNYSGIVMKSTGRCELLSWTADEYNYMQSDGNGGMKKGLWPADFLFAGPCDVDAPSTAGPGYNGYQSESCCPVWGASSVTVDRRNGNMYLGMNFKSYSTTVVTPDFEPAVIAFDHEGALRWWSRLYHEITPAGDTVPSIPDQYVDALAIDYAHDQLVVCARAHGNNTENLWEGNEIAANASANGFQNRFTGTNGNIHESWLGKLLLTDGTLMHSTFVAEYAEGTGGFGSPHPDPNLDGWPNPNDGWPDVNTTRLIKNNMKVTSSGDVVVGGLGRRTITTANAYQKMVLPYYGGLSSWNAFVRQYNSDLSLPKYSSLVVGVWDTLTQAGGGNTELFGVYKTANGIVAVGRHTMDATTTVANGNAIPVSNVPTWGESLPESESAILVYYTAGNIVNEEDDFNTSSFVMPMQQVDWSIYPNPATSVLQLRAPSGKDYIIRNPLGQIIITGKTTSGISVIDISSLSRGIYNVQLEGDVKRFVKG